MSASFVPLLQALAPIGVDLALKIIEAIKRDDLTQLTPDDWLELLRHSVRTSDERLMVILQKHQPPTP